MSIKQVTDPLPLADLIELSDERDRWLRRIAVATHRGYERGRLDGYREGYAAADADWTESLTPAREAARRAATTPTHTELELRRWALRGEVRTRQTFGLPHPDDFTGHDAA